MVFMRKNYLKVLIIWINEGMHAISACEWRKVMKKKSIAIVMSLMIGLTGCGQTSNKEKKTKDVKATVEASKDNKAQSDNNQEQTQTDANSYPGITIQQKEKQVESEDGKTVYCYTYYHYPVIDKTAYKELAEGLEQYFKKDLEEFYITADQLADDAKKKLEQQPDMEIKPNYTVGNDLIQSRADAKVLCIEMEKYQFFDSQRQKDVFTGLTFSTETGAFLTQSDIIPDQKKFEDTVTEYIYEQVELAHKKLLHENYKEEIQESLQHLNWYFNDYGMVILFNENEITKKQKDVYTNVIRVEVPYSMLKECIQAQYIPDDNVESVYQLRESSSYQMQLDKEETAVQLVIKKTKEESVKNVILKTEKKDYQLYDSKEGWYWGASAFVVKNKDGQQFIALQKNSDNDGKDTSIFTLKDGKLTETDNVFGGMEERALHAKKLILNTSEDIFGTYGVNRVFIINKDGKVEYDSPIREFVDYTGTGHVTTLTARQEVHVVIEGEETKLVKGDKIYPTGVDDTKFYFETESGKKGFLQYEKAKEWGWAVDGVKDDEAFEGVMYAG